MTKAVVIIPTYNEKENVSRIIDAVFNLKQDYHVLIIDDNSPDGTGQIVKEKQPASDGKLHIVERKGKLGLGTAYIKGFEWSLENGYDYVFEMDADFSHNPEDLPRLLEACQKGADLAIGSRYVSGVNVVNWPIGRVLMSYFASKYVRVVTGLKIADTTAGFKCYSRKVLEAINFEQIRFKGYAFQIEMKFTAWQLGFKLVEVPIVFTDRTAGTSKMSGGIFNEAVWGVLSMKMRSIFHSTRKKHKFGEK